MTEPGTAVKNCQPGLGIRIARAVRGAARALRDELRPRYNWQGIHERFDEVGGPIVYRGTL